MKVKARKTELFARSQLLKEKLKLEEEEIRLKHLKEEVKLKEELAATEAKANVYKQFEEDGSVYLDRNRLEETVFSSEGKRNLPIVCLKLFS